MQLVHAQTNQQVNNSYHMPATNILLVQTRNLSLKEAAEKDTRKLLHAGVCCVQSLHAYKDCVLLVSKALLACLNLST